MKLYRAFATVGGLTLVSRILGFFRDILIAAVLGTGLVADAFFVAFRFPNLFRRLFGEGAFNSAFVPLFAKALEGEGKSVAREFAEQSLSVLLTALLIFTAIAEIAMPWLMYAIAPGFSDTPEKFELAIVLTRIAFPYLLCMSLVALLSGVLNALDRFAAAAAAPILLNIILIAAMAFCWLFGIEASAFAGKILSWAVTIAGVLQLLLLYMASRNADMKLTLRRPRLTPQVRRLVTLGVPGIIAGGITQINILVGTIIASMQDSAVSYLYYADRIYQLPLGVVGIAIGVVLLPDLSRKLRAGNIQAVHDSQNRSLEFSFILTLPAAIALLIIPHQILSVLFERGVFTSADTNATALALSAFAFGLPAFVLIKVFSPAFFAREDTRTPMHFAGISMIVNVVLSLALFFIFRSQGFQPHVGIAIATSVAGWVNAGLLAARLRKNGNLAMDAKLRGNLPKIIFASILMGVGVWFLAEYFAPYMAPVQGFPIQFATLLSLVVAGVAIFALFILATRVITISQLRQMRGGAN